MSSREVVVWLDERWYDALSRQLKKKDTTIEDELNSYLDAMINLLPAPTYERISREVREEDQRRREAAEAARRLSVFRVAQDGRTDHLLTEAALSNLPKAAPRVSVGLLNGYTKTDVALCCCQKN